MATNAITTCSVVAIELQKCAQDRKLMISLPDRLTFREVFNHYHVADKPKQGEFNIKSRDHSDKDPSFTL